jgi:hypothetical protein
LVSISSLLFLTVIQHLFLLYLSLLIFVEGNGVHYVTGSGQTQPTKDRVTIYEIEGNVTPVKRQLRKPKGAALEDASEPSSRPSTATKRKATHVKNKRIVTRITSGPVLVRAGVRQSQSPAVEFPSNTAVSDSVSNEIDEKEEQVGEKQANYLPFPFTAMAPPIPVRRSQSSFSKAAADIAGYSVTDQQDAMDKTNSRMSSPDSSFVYSPRECYLDVEADGKMRKVTSATWGMSSSLSSSSLSCMSPRSQQHNPDYQLQMLREASEDSDFTADDRTQATDYQLSAGANLLPPYLMHQQSTTLSLPPNTIADNVADNAVCNLGSPNTQPRNLERCPTESFEEEGEMEYEFLDVLSRQQSFSWLSRSTSATSLSGRDSVLTNA